MKTLVVPGKAVHAGNLLLVNGQRPYREGISKCPFVTVNSGSDKVSPKRRASVMFLELMNDIDGLTRISAMDTSGGNDL